MQFGYTFREVDQTVYFAYSIPYTYTDLERFVTEIKMAHPRVVGSRRLCESLGGV